MDCEAVSSKLIDLVYGEVDSAEMPSLEGHLASCVTCARTLQRLEGGLRVTRKLETIDPPVQALDAIRAAAVARTAQVERPRTHPESAAEKTRKDTSTSSEPQTFWEWIVGFLGSFAMGPQVVTATLLLLMVGIGLWSVPHLRAPAVSRHDSVFEHETGNEVSPSAGALQPAEPLAFDFDPRTRRLAPIGDKDQDVMAAPAAPSAQVAGSPQARPMASGERRASAVSREAPPPMPVEVAATDEHSRTESEDMLGQSADATEGIARASRTRAADSEEAPASAPAAAPLDALSAGALHQEARAASGRGADAECVRQYEALIARFPTYEETGRALLELAQCQRRMGELSAAAHTLERARRHASVRAEAGRELSRIAGDEAREAASAPASAE